MGNTLKYIHAIESLQVDLRVNQQWEAARSLNNTIELLRHGLEIEVLKYENRFENTARVG